jgi:hypothetical protein
MTRYLETKICDVDDEEFQSLIDELCQCANWERSQFDTHTLRFLLMATGKEARELSQQHFAFKGVLTTKVDKLLPGSVVFAVCQELVRLKHSHIEAFDGKSVLTLIKHCYVVFWQKPKPPRRRRPIP